MSTTLTHPATDPTQAQKLQVKLLLTSPLPEVDPIIHVFQQWIRDQSLPGHLLLDVVDYKHVKDGPGVVLISHEAHIHLDFTDGQIGLLYKRRSPLPGSLAERLKTTLTLALSIAEKLKADPALAGQFNIDNRQLIVGTLDRLHAPNTPATAQVLTPILAEVLKELASAAPQLSVNPDPLRGFEVTAKLADPFRIA